MNKDFVFALLRVIEAVLAVIGAGVIVLVVWFESDGKEKTDKLKEMFEDYEEFW